MTTEAHPRDLEPEFSKWMLKLTADKLFSKADIAMEFAMLERALAAQQAEHEAEVVAWKPVADVIERQVAWIDRNARYIAVVVNKQKYLLTLPLLPLAEAKEGKA